MKMRQIIGCAMAALLALMLTACGGEDAGSSSELSDISSAEETVYAARESVMESIAKFNTQVLDRGIEYPVQEAYQTVENGTYFYGVFEDIGFYVKPVAYTGDREADLAKNIAVFYDVGSKNEELALQYVKCLIKANLEGATDSEIDALVAEADRLANQGVADRNDGIFLQRTEQDGGIYYLLTRNYESSAN